MSTSKEEIYDVAVIGLGPAGAVLARMLAPHFKVVAFDMKKISPAEPGFHKPCGGLLAEDAQQSLSRQGYALPNSVLADPQLFSVRTIDLCRGYVRNYRRFYVNMDRHKFDLWLKSLIPAGTNVLNNVRVKTVSRTQNSTWEIVFSENGEYKTAFAKNIVGADGAASLIRKTLFPSHKIRNYTAIQEWFKDEEPSPQYACFFDERLTDCYGWAISKDGQIVFGAAFPRKDSAQAYSALLERARNFGFKLGEPIRREACQVLRPEHMRDFRLGKDGAFLIGEAAGFISPSSLEGMSYAMDSAELLAQSLIESRNAEDILKNYTAKTRKLRLKLLSKILKNPFMYNPHIRGIVMRSGIASHKVSE